MAGATSSEGVAAGTVPVLDGVMMRTSLPSPPGIFFGGPIGSPVAGAPLPPQQGLLQQELQQLSQQSWRWNRPFRRCMKWWPRSQQLSQQLVWQQLVWQQLVWQHTGRQQVVWQQLVWQHGWQQLSQQSLRWHQRRMRSHRRSRWQQSQVLQHELQHELQIGADPQPGPAGADWPVAQADAINSNAAFTRIPPYTGPRAAAAVAGDIPTTV